MQTAVNFTGNTVYANDSNVVALDVFNIAPKIPLGAIGCVGVCVGLEAEASGHADIDARFAVGYQSVLDLNSKANARTFMFGAGTEPAMGTPFILVNRIDPLGIQKLNVHTQSFDAFVGLDVDLGGTARAKACLVGCVEAWLKLKVDDVLPLGGIVGGALKVFGQTVDSTVPYSYAAPGGVASASANIPTFKTTYANVAPGATATGAPMQEPVLKLNLDVAALVAKAAGFPIPLEGDLLGFDYTLLSLDTFAGLDVRHDFAFKVVDLKTTYHFTSPVQVFDEATQTWGAAVTSLTLGDYESVKLRNLLATSLGITRSYSLGYRADFGYDLILSAGLDLDALGISGYGIHLGPLLDPDPWKVNLASFEIESGTKLGSIASTGSTSTLAFNPLVFDPGAGVLVDTCAGLPGGCQKTGFVGVRTDLGDGTFVETTYRVTNFGVAGCGANSLLDCNIDPAFEPVVRHVRPGPTRAGENVAVDPSLLGLALLDALRAAGIDPGAIPTAQFLGEYAMDFRALQAFLDAPPLDPGERSNDELLRAGLAALGVDLANPFPPFVLGPGAPPLTIALAESRSETLELTAVPEPSMLALLAIAGVGLVCIRRRCRLRNGSPAVRAATPRVAFR